MEQELGNAADGGREPLASNCVICGTPLGGVGSVVFRVFGIARSSRNPNLCSRCNTHVAEGNVTDLTVLFADLSGFTQLTGALGAERVYKVVDAFLQMCAEVLVRQGAYIDKYIGDAVMALFNAPIALKDHAARAVAASVEIHERCLALQERFGQPVRARIGIASGPAHIGRLGSRDARDVTAIGTPVNLAARLQSAAGLGQTALAREVYEQVASTLPAIAPESMTLKGFPEPVPMYRLIPEITRGKGRLGEVPFDGSRRRGFTVGPLIFALLGAPCAATAFVGSGAVALGLASLLGVSSAGAFFDDWRIRYPLAIVAILGTLANLYAAWHAGRVRARFLAHGRILTPTRGERVRTVVVIGSAILTFAVIASEWFSHRVLMHRPWL